MGSEAMLSSGFLFVGGFAYGIVDGKYLATVQHINPQGFRSSCSTTLCFLMVFEHADRTPYEIIWFLVAIYFPSAVVALRFF